jgi:hypothetical protein
MVYRTSLTWATLPYLSSIPSFAKSGLGQRMAMEIS